MGQKLSIAMIGQKGVPATFGGIEHVVEELGSRLADRGHDVMVYCRRGYSEQSLPSYRGMRLRYLPTVSSKHLEAFIHSGVSAVDAVFARPDIVHFHALGPGLFSPISRWLGRSAVVQTIHGLDNQREKWGFAAQRILDAGEWMSAHVPAATVVVSSELERHYLERWDCKCVHIPNGVLRPHDTSTPEALAASRTRIEDRFGLEAGGYFVFVGRLVPEKRVDVLLKAYRRFGGDRKLVIVGGSSHVSAFERELESLAAADPRAQLVGYQFGQALVDLYENAAAFVLPSELEGLPLVVLEAASHGVPLILSDLPPHLEIVGAERSGARLCSPNSEESLVAALARSVADPVAERVGAATIRGEVLARFDWDRVTDETESLYREVLQR